MCGTELGNLSYINLVNVSFLVSNNWDFENIWNDVYDGVDYPILKWEFRWENN